VSELRDLYQEVILDHNRRPRNFRALEDADRKAEGFNPLCGDHLTLFLKVRDQHVVEVAFQGLGCAISKASASLMTEGVKGKTFADVETLYQAFHDMVTGQPGQQIDSDRLGKLAVFAGVCEFPVRVKCATLPWRTLQAALKDQKSVATTE
jgi:nitrogen fixation NifU-like protein